jgi:hypothetical protein
MNPENEPNGEQREHPLSCLIGYGIAVILFAMFCASLILAIDGSGH